MADTGEMVRIIRHAADRLAEENPVPMFADRIGAMGYAADRAEAIGALMSLRLAMGYAESVLRMVAACMDDEPDAATPAGPEPVTTALTRVDEPDAATPAGSEAAAVSADAKLDPALLYKTLNTKRVADGLSWREVAQASGVAASGYTKLGQGGCPSAPALVRMLAWLGSTDLAPYLTGGET